MVGGLKSHRQRGDLKGGDGKRHVTSGIQSWHNIITHMDQTMMKRCDDHLSRLENSQK